MIVYAPIDERQFWVETLDGSGNRTGIISNIRNASVKRVLDGVGDISIEIPGTDKEASDLLQDGVKVRIYVSQRDDEEKRLLGSGIIRKRRASDTSSNFSLICSGPDDLDDLRNKSVLQALEYNENTLDEIINGAEAVTGLLDHLNGWSATVDVSESHYARFDGARVLTALQKLVEDKGLHFRLGDNAQTLEVGDFGVSNGITLVQAPAYMPEMDSNDDIGIIESIAIEEDGTQTVDFIVALGATTGSDVALTLADSTRTDPYPIQADTWNGKTYYYIGRSVKSLAAIFADNTLRLKMLSFDQIQIQSNSNADIESAANALYDAAVAYLIRHLEPHKQYSIMASKLRSNVKPGDKMRVQYKGWIEDSEGNLLPPVDINTDFWIMDVSESVNLDGVKTSLKLTNIDMHKLDAARIIVGEIENAKIRNLSVKPYTTATSYVYARELDPTHSARIPIRITDRVLRVRQVTLNVKSTPFRSTAVGGAAGGNHTHVMFGNGVPAAAIAANTLYNSAGGQSVQMYANGSPATLTTFGASGTHTHPQDYGIYDDTQYPGEITLSVNGNDHTIALGGTWGSSVSEIDFTVDITEYILAATTLRQIHEVVFGCGSGQGRIEVSVEIYQDVQNVRVQ
jgi:hypothetical protein